MDKPRSRFLPPEPPPEMTRVSALEMTPVQSAQVFMWMVFQNWTITEQAAAENEQIVHASHQRAYVRWLRSAPDETEIATYLARQQDSAP